MSGPTSSRQAKLFKNNRSQAVRIPAEFRLNCDRVLISREGDRLIIEPVNEKDLLELLSGMEPLGPEDGFPEIDDSLLELRTIEL